MWNMKQFLLVHQTISKDFVPNKSVEDCLAKPTQKYNGVASKLTLGSNNASTRPLASKRRSQRE